MKMVATKKGIKLSQKNKRKNIKRESFLPEDKEWLNEHNEIETGNRLGSGCYGIVYSVKNNSKLIVKVDHRSDDRDLRQEMTEYRQHSMSKQPLFIPSKSVSVIMNGKKRFGVVKPKVQVCNEPTNGKQYYLTDEEIEQIRQKIVQLTKKGYVLDDRIQVGKDTNGRILQFDTGKIKKLSARHKSETTNEAYTTNECAWEVFLRKQEKWRQTFSDSETDRQLQRALEKYGRVDGK